MVATKKVKSYVIYSSENNNSCRRCLLYIGMPLSTGKFPIEQNVDQWPKSGERGVGRGGWGGGAFMLLTEIVLYFHFMGQIENNESFLWEIT